MKKWNVAAVRAAKGRERLGCVTAYDACFARLADEAGVPVILVGDSQGMNCLGYETTLPVNMSDTLAAVAAVSRGAKDEQVPLRLPDLMIVLTGGEMAYRRNDGVFVIPLGCLKD